MINPESRAIVSLSDKTDADILMGRLAAAGWGLYATKGTMAAYGKQTDSMGDLLDLDTTSTDGEREATAQGVTQLILQGYVHLVCVNLKPPEFVSKTADENNLHIKYDVGGLAMIAAAISTDVPVVTRPVDYVSLLVRLEQPGGIIDPGFTHRLQSTASQHLTDHTNAALDMQNALASRSGLPQAQHEN